MRGAVNSAVKLKIMRGASKEVEGIQDRPRRHQGPVGALARSRATTSATSASPNSPSRPRDGLKAAMEKLHTDIPADKFKGYILDLRNNPGGLLDQSIEVVNAFVDKRRDRFDARPQPRRRAALQRAAGRRPLRRQADGGADQRRLGLRLRDRRRRAAGPQARDADRHALVRQGLGADDHAARRGRRAAPDDGALLHAVGPLDPGQGHRPRHRDPRGRSRRPARARTTPRARLRSRAT